MSQAARSRAELQRAEAEAQRKALADEALAPTSESKGEATSEARPQQRATDERTEEGAFAARFKAVQSTEHVRVSGREAGASSDARARGEARQASGPMGPPPRRSTPQPRRADHRHLGDAFGS